METPATKRQTIAEDTMAATEQSYFLHELELRREHLLSATRANAADQSLSNLLASVDSALSRLQNGTFGICETCHDPIEEDRLRCNPLLRFCLDHLSGEEQRALERDLTLAARIQRALLPPPDWSSAGWQARYHYQPGRPGQRRLLRLDRIRWGLPVLARRCRWKRRCGIHVDEPSARDVSHPGRPATAIAAIGGTRQPAFLRQHHRGAVRHSRGGTCLAGWQG